MATSPRLNQEERFTYADYLTWPDEERWEIIDGVAYSMSPSPGRRHQELSGALFNQFCNFLKGKLCKVYHAPFDVRFVEQLDASDNYVETVVQPDLLVVCDKSKLDERGCKGAPDLVVEILSPTTGGKDLTVKHDLYQKHNVKEYWIIHPMELTLLVYKVGNDNFYGIPERYGSDGKVPVPLLGDLVIDLAEVFAE